MARVAEGKDDGLNQGPGLPAKEQGFILPCCLTPLLGKPVDAGVVIKLAWKGRGMMIDADLMKMDSLSDIMMSYGISLE